MDQVTGTLVVWLLGSRSDAVNVLYYIALNNGCQLDDLG